MKKVKVKVSKATCDETGVSIRVKFEIEGNKLIRDFFYTHPTSLDDIVADLTTFANFIKVSFEAPEALKELEFEV